MTPQSLFDKCSYAMLAHGAAPTETLAGMWNGGRIPGLMTCRHLAADLETIYNNRAPHEWRDALEKLAETYNLEMPG